MLFELRVCIDEIGRKRKDYRIQSVEIYACYVGQRERVRWKYTRNSVEIRTQKKVNKQNGVSVSVASPHLKSTNYSQGEGTQSWNDIILNDTQPWNQLSAQIDSLEYYNFLS